MTKRNFVLQTAIAAAMVSAFTPAMASSIGRSAAAASIPAYANDYTIAAESTARNYAVNLDSAVATVNEGALNDRAISGTIRWVPTFGLNTGDVCTFTFVNARYMSADFKLLGEEHTTQQPNITSGLAANLCGAGIDGLDINGDSVCSIAEVASNFGTLNPATGVASVQARINNGLALPTGINLVLAKNTGVDAGLDGTLDDETMNVTMRIPAGTGAGNVRVSSACVTSGGVTIGAADASGTIMDLESQFGMSVTKATSTVDVGAATPRTMFLEEGAAADVISSTNDTDLTASAATYTFNNDSNSTVEDFITLVAGDTLALTLTSSTDLSALSTAGGASFVEDTGIGTDVAGTNNDTNYNFTLASPNMTSATIPGDQLPLRGTAGSDDIVITVDGSSVITDRNFTGSAALAFAAPQYTDASFSLGTTHEWTTNGTILNIPFVTISSGYNGKVQIMNTGATAAPYSTVFYTEAGIAATAGATATGTVPANGVVSIPVDSNFVTVAGTTPEGGQNRVAFEMTIAAPSTNIQAHYRVSNPVSGIVTQQELHRKGTN